MIDVRIPTSDGRELALTRYTQPEPDLKLLLASSSHCRRSRPRKSPPPRPRPPSPCSADLPGAVPEESVPYPCTTPRIREEGLRPRREARPSSCCSLFWGACGVKRCSADLLFDSPLGARRLALMLRGWIWMCSGPRGWRILMRAAINASSLSDQLAAMVVDVVAPTPACRANSGVAYSVVGTSKGSLRAGNLAIHSRSSR
jgi:hypothetical protein